MSNLNMPIEIPYMTWYLMALVILPYLSSFPKFSLLKCTLTWPWLLELINVRRTYVNRKAILHFLFDGNSNCYHIYHHFQDIHSLKCAWPWSWLLKWVKVTCKYVNRKARNDLLFDGDSIFYHICHNFLRNSQSKMYMTLTLTFRLCQGQM